jgi:hypothetical protein
MLNTLVADKGAAMEFVLVYLISAAISLAILYAVITAAVKSALFAHYKVVRWYEATGEWLPRTGSWKDAPSKIGDRGPIDRNTLV